MHNYREQLPFVPKPSFREWLKIVGGTEHIDWDNVPTPFSEHCRQNTEKFLTNLGESELSPHKKELSDFMRRLEKMKMESLEVGETMRAQHILSWIRTLAPGLFRINNVERLIFVISGTQIANPLPDNPHDGSYMYI